MAFLSSHWFDLVQTVSIIATLLITLHAISEQSKHIKVSNSLLITQHHREIWSNIFGNDRLQRVFQKDVDIEKAPITDEERMFVNMVFLHMSATLKAQAAGAIYKVEGMERDIVDILSYPIPRKVWGEVYRFHDQMFAEYVFRHDATKPTIAS